MIEIGVTLWVTNCNFPLENRRLGRFSPDGGDQAQVRKQRVFRCQFVSLHQLRQSESSIYEEPAREDLAGSIFMARFGMNFGMAV